MSKHILEQLAATALFAKVVELKSFSATAKHFGITKSSVSKQIAHLERLLDAKLLHRTTRALSLTEAGREFYERAAQTVELAEDARTTISQLAEMPRGTLRITTPVAYGKLCIAPLLPEFLARFPDIRIQISMVDRIVDLADEGFDVAIRLTRSLPDRVIAKKIAANRYVVCAAPSYLHKHPRPRVPQDLTRLNCLYYGVADSDKWTFENSKGRETIVVRGNLIVNHGEVLRDALLAGLGVALLPTFVVERELRMKRLVPVLPNWQPIGSFNTVYAVWLPNRHASPKTRVFVDYVTQKLNR